MKNKKGFTLIELLAVILILGVIALIAVPTVTDLINESKVGAESSTANQLVVSAETYGALCQLRQDETCITDFTTLTDENFKDYLIDEVGIKMYPTLLTFKNNRLSFCAEGETSMISFRYICDIGFNNILKEEDFIDDKGENVLKINRSIDDVKNDLSSENQNKIKSLDNDNYTEELTYTLMSKQLDFDKISNRKSDVYINEIEDYSVYKDKQLVLLYTFLRDNSQTDKVEFINEIIDDNPNMNFIVVLIEGLESSSAALRNMKIRFKCPVVSTLGMMPDDFFRFGISSYPTAIFVNEGVFVGGYSNIESKEKFKEAISVFLSEDSVAYKKNN